MAKKNPAIPSPLQRSSGFIFELTALDQGERPCKGVFVLIRRPPIFANTHYFRVGVTDNGVKSGGKPLFVGKIGK